MRRYGTFFLIAVMSFGLVVMLLSRARTPYDAPAEVLEVAVDAGDAGSRDAAVDASDAAPEAGKTERPLRVVTLGWELASPAAVLGDAGTIEVAPEPLLESVGARLARGGADPAGADVAIMPLPAFVASYEKLRALEPKAFLVVGFSRGREELHAATGALVKAPNPAEEVKLVALAPSTAQDANARVAGTESATVLGLFVLDLLGAPPTRVRFVAPGTDGAKAASFAAIAKGASDDRKLGLSTADASRLVPIVAVAPKTTLDDPRVQAFARTWLESLAKARGDAAGVSRRLAAKDGVPLGVGVGGAPEAVALLEQLGTVEPATLADQGVYIGSKHPVTLETLLQRTWSLERGGGLTSIAPPDPLPIDARIVQAIAPRGTERPRAEAPEGDAGAAFATIPPGSTVLLVYRAPTESNAEAVATQISFLSEMFERASFRISAKGGEKAARAIAAEARDKHDVPHGRMATVAAEPTGAFAVVEILVLP